MRIPGLGVFFRCLLLVSVAGAAQAQATQSPSPNDYAGRWPLQLQAAAAAGVFEPGPDLYRLLQDPAFGDLQVFDATGTPMPMARAAQDGAPRWVAATFASAGPADGAAGDAGVMGYAFRLRADVPVSGARIGFGSAAANVALQHQQADGRWQTAARMPVALPERVGEAQPSGEVAFPAPIAAHAWRVISGRALSPSPNLQLSIRPARFVFLAQGTPPYVLAAGHPLLRRTPASLDAELARLRAVHGASWQPAPATIGPATTTPFVAAAAAVEAEPGWRRWWPWAVAGLALLAPFCFLLLRRRRRSRAA